MTKIIVANWKMNGGNSFIETFFKEWKKPNNQHIIIFCPSFPYLTKIRGLTDLVGGQDCHQEESGAYTGNVSASMLADVGAKYVILGHSERRQYHGEESSLVRLKAEQALKNNITPIICVGENLNERQSGQAVATVLHQLQESLPSIQEGIIAYEPVWAIGTGLTASEEEIGQMHQAIAQAYPRFKILYGGSVNEKNSATIMSIDHVDGVLVGGASMKADAFQVICQ